MSQLLNKEYIISEYGSVDAFLEKAYAADIAEFLMEIPKEEVRDILDRFSDKEKARIISYVNEKTAKHIAKTYDARALSVIISNMYSDDAADFLGIMSVGKVKEVLNLMKKELAVELQKLMEFDEKSAGGLMNTEYIAFYEDHTVEEVIKNIRNLVHEQEMIYYIYILNRRKMLVGVVSVRQLLIARPETVLKDIMNENVIKVTVNTEQQEVARLLSKYDLLALPVVNKHDQLLGVITIDDALDIIEEEATEDIYKISVTSDIESAGGVLQAVKQRLPWLIILLFGDLLAGSVISGFEESLQAVVALAFFIPVLMDMGGNIGTQVLTVVVRGLATGELRMSDFKNHLSQEIKVGFIIAIIIGISISLIAVIWQSSLVLGFIIGLSMFLTLVTSAAVGTIMPFVVKRLGVDPAIAAGPFITTIIDITGLLIYFSIASLLMEKLI